MDRRNFLVGFALSSLSATLADLALAQTIDPWLDSFARALASNPNLVGYASVDAQTPLSARLPFEGKLPPGLRGTLYRNGPALHEFAGMRYHHWFDGDGMVQAFRLGDDGLTHTGRLVLTEKLASEIKAGKRLRAVFGTALQDGERPSGNDSLNSANTNVLPVAGELLAMWEGGSAFSIDPDTLATKGPKVWRADLKGVPFSAHPKVDQGAVWNFGLDQFTSTMVLYEIGHDGVLKRAELLQVPDMVRVHDFVVTRRHLVFLLPPMRFSDEKFQTGESFVDCHEWKADAPLRVMIVEKADLKTHRIFELPNGFVFHLGNAWEDEAGVIRLDYVRADDASDLTTSFRDVMRGKQSGNKAGRSYHVVLDTRSGRIAQSLVEGGVEFPRVDPRFVGERHRQLYHVVQIRRGTGSEGSGGFDGVRRLDVDTGAIDQYSFGLDFLAEEHVFVPDQSRSTETGGFLLGTVLDLKRSRTQLSVFDAMNLAAGPLATATLPYSLPLGLHGNFKAA
jgi:carotenoid cleavage dioxygenase